MTNLIKSAAVSLVGLLALAAGPAAGQVVTTLHSFKGGTIDGAGPGTSLLQIGNLLYGMTNVGGSSGNGTMYRLGTDGTGYGTIYSFAGFPNDGGNPFGSLTLYQSALYGTTSGGGSSGAGTIVTVGPDGGGYRLVHQFTGGPTDGASPQGSLTQIGQAFYGVTRYGGSVPDANGQYNFGAIFRTSADGTSYTVLHSFGGPGDGQAPTYVRLVASGNTLYGTTFGGGTAGFGTIFKINADGTGYAVLHSFTGSSADGEIPYGSLTLVGGKLYGMTGFGGAANRGTIFNLNTDGTGFGIVHSFAGGSNDGATPLGGLLLSSSRLYGATLNGGRNALGALFGVDPDGTDFNLLYSFKGGPDDGANPFGDLIVSGATFYGTTNAGGSDNLGTVFSFTVVPEPSSLALVLLGGVAVAYRCRASAISRIRRRARNNGPQSLRAARLENRADQT